MTDDMKGAALEKILTAPLADLFFLLTIVIVPLLSAGFGYAIWYISREDRRRQQAQHDRLMTEYTDLIKSYTDVLKRMANMAGANNKPVSRKRSET